MQSCHIYRHYVPNTTIATTGYCFFPRVLLMSMCVSKWACLFHGDQWLIYTTLTMHPMPFYPCDTRQCHDNQAIHNRRPHVIMLPCWNHTLDGNNANTLKKGVRMKRDVTHLAPPTPCPYHPMHAAPPTGWWNVVRYGTTQLYHKPF